VNVQNFSVVACRVLDVSLGSTDCSILSSPANSSQEGCQSSLSVLILALIQPSEKQSEKNSTGTSLLPHFVFFAFFLFLCSCIKTHDSGETFSDFHDLCYSTLFGPNQSVTVCIHDSCLSVLVCCLMSYYFVVYDQFIRK